MLNCCASKYSAEFFFFTGRSEKKCVHRSDLNCQEMKIGICRVYLKKFIFWKKWVHKFLFSFWQFWLGVFEASKKAFQVTSKMHHRLKTRSWIKSGAGGERCPFRSRWTNVSRPRSGSSTRHSWSCSTTRCQLSAIPVVQVSRTYLMCWITIMAPCGDLSFVAL